MSITPKPDIAAIRPPKGAVATWFWRRRMWFESTFVLSMLEPWEKVMLCPYFRSFAPYLQSLNSSAVTILFLLIILLLVGLFQYFPRHLVEMQQRAVYYLWGKQAGSFLKGTSGLRSEL